MTTLKPSVHQIPGHLWNVKKLAQKYKLDSFFGAKQLVTINYSNAVFTVQFLQKYNLHA